MQPFNMTDFIPSKTTLQDKFLLDWLPNVIAIFLLLLIIVGFLTFFLGWQGVSFFEAINPKVGEQIKQELLAEHRLKVLTGLLTLLGGFVGVAAYRRGYLNYKLEQSKHDHEKLKHAEMQQADITREQNKRFAEANALLAHENIDLRAGAIYALGDLMNENPEKFARRVLQLLCTYARIRSVKLKAKFQTVMKEAREFEEKNGPLEEYFDDSDFAFEHHIKWNMINEGEVISLEDLKATAIVLSNRTHCLDLKLDLEGVFWAFLDFKDVKLVNMNLNNAVLFGTKWFNCTIEQIDLENTNFDYSVFDGCTLNELDFFRADLLFSKLYTCNISNTRFNSKHCVFQYGLLDTVTFSSLPIIETKVSPKMLNIQFMLCGRPFSKQDKETLNTIIPNFTVKDLLKRAIEWDPSLVFPDGNRYDYPSSPKEDPPPF